MIIQQHFWVFNSYARNMPVDINIGGDLGIYANTSAFQVNLGPNGIAEFDIIAKLPQALPAGINTLTITARDQPPTGVPFGASTASTIVMQIKVPYEGKFPIARLHVDNVPETEPVIANVTVENMGKVDIKDLYADIVFFSGTDEVGSVQTAHVPLTAHESTSLLVPWHHNVTAGIYDANATVHGDENTTYARTQFLIGEKDVQLVTIDKDLTANQVNTIRFTLLNRWNEGFNNAKVVISAGPSDNMGWRAVGPEFSLQPWHPQPFIYYMSVPAVNPGTYPGVVEITFGGVTKRIDVQFNVLAGAEVQAPATRQSMTVTVVRLLMLLIVIVIVVLLWRSRKREKNA
jgi:hypothetical protein